MTRLVYYQNNRSKIREFMHKGIVPTNAIHYMEIAETFQNMKGKRCDKVTKLSIKTGRSESNINHIISYMSQGV